MKKPLNIKSNSSLNKPKPETSKTIVIPKKKSFIANRTISHVVQPYISTLKGLVYEEQLKQLIKVLSSDQANNPSIRKANERYIIECFDNSVRLSSHPRLLQL